MTRFRTLRGRLTAGALIAAAIGIAILIVAFNVLLAGALQRDVNSRLRSQAAAAATTVTVERGRVHVQESPDDAAIDRAVWIYDGTRAVERAQEDAEMQRFADALAGESHVFTDIPGRDVRLYATQITDDGQRVGTIVAGGSLAAYDRTTDLALIASVVLAAVLLGIIAAMAWLTTGRALAPVRDMTRSAAEWSEHDPGRRFGADHRPDELGELAATFDALLGRVAASLRHEQRLSAELSHELRTPLARMVAELELLQRRDRDPESRQEAYAAMVRSAEQMSAILEMLMAAARADSGLDRGRSNVRGVLEDVRDGWAPAPGERDVALDVDAPDDTLTAGVDVDVVGRILAPVLENARRHAAGHVTVSVRESNGSVVIAVADDGPGVPADLRERVFEPGARGPGADAHPGAGLGLSLARRLARAASGDVAAVDPRAGRGAEFRVTLPR